MLMEIEGGKGKKTEGEAEEEEKGRDKFFSLKEKRETTRKKKVVEDHLKRKS